MTTSVDFGRAWSLTKWSFDKDGNLDSIGLIKAVGEVVNPSDETTASTLDLRRNETGDFVQFEHTENNNLLTEWQREFSRYQQTQSLNNQ